VTINKLTKIDVIYWKSELDTKRKIIGSIYKEKFFFEDLEHRVASLTDPFKFTYLINKQLNEVNNPHLRWGLYLTPERGYSSEQL
jgi:hypothetical protein